MIARSSRPVIRVGGNDSATPSPSCHLRRGPPFFLSSGHYLAPDLSPPEIPESRRSRQLYPPRQILPYDGVILARRRGVTLVTAS